MAYGIQALTQMRRTSGNDAEHPDVRRLGRAGLGGDSTIGHLTPGELVIPQSAQTPGLMALFSKEMRARGMNPERYKVDSGYTSRNPTTGAQQFYAGEEGGYGQGAFGDAVDVGMDYDAASSIGAAAVGQGGGMSGFGFGYGDTSPTPASPPSTYSGNLEDALGYTPGFLEKSIKDPPGFIKDVLDFVMKNSITFRAAKGLGDIADALGIQGRSGGPQDGHATPGSVGEQGAGSGLEFAQSDADSRRFASLAAQFQTVPQQGGGITNASSDDDDEDGPASETPPFVDYYNYGFGPEVLQYPWWYSASGNFDNGPDRVSYGRYLPRNFGEA
jgi:hypothetical protein